VFGLALMIGYRVYGRSKARQGKGGAWVVGLELALSVSVCVCVCVAGGRMCIVWYVLSTR